MTFCCPYRYVLKWPAFSRPFSCMEIPVNGGIGWWPQYAQCHFILSRQPYDMFLTCNHHSDQTATSQHKVPRDQKHHSWSGNVISKWRVSILLLLMYWQCLQDLYNGTSVQSEFRVIENYHCKLWSVELLACGIFVSVKPELVDGGMLTAHQHLELSIGI